MTPTSGRVKRGKTVQVGALSQTLAELEPFADDRVSDVVAKQRTSFVAAGQVLSPGQLLERLGFSQEQLATPVRDLSGGQKRRLQLLVVLLAEPNVLILDEPTNDLDTDMLAAIEDLLDSWPGTLLVVSHDRYLIERVTDHQFAVLDGRLRHLPGGVEEYLRLRAGEQESRWAQRRAERSIAAPDPTPSDSAQERRDRKEVARLERQIEKLSAREAELEKKMVEAATDPESLIPLDAELREVVAKRERAEDAWLALTT